jgi:hypothetical protein
MISADKEKTVYHKVFGTFKLKQGKLKNLNSRQTSILNRYLFWNL